MSLILLVSAILNGKLILEPSSEHTCGSIRMTSYPVTMCLITYSTEPQSLVSPIFPA